MEEMHLKQYNVIVVFDHEARHVLMCMRSKEPYKGKFNFIGGKIENGEIHLQAAYRELYEETSITSDDIKLIYVMDFVFHITNCSVELYVGKLNRQVKLIEEENPLFWVELSKDFSDLNCFAGDGDIAYIMKYLDNLGLNNILNH